MFLALIRRNRFAGMTRAKRNALVLIAVLAGAAAGAEAGVVPLGTAGNFAVLGGSTVTNTGSSTISGDLGVGPGTSITGFPPGIVTGGTIHASDAAALQARADATGAFNVLAGLPLT